MRISRNKVFSYQFYLFALFIVACSGNGNYLNDSDEDPQLGRTKITKSDSLVKSAIPENLDARLANRDTAPLPEGAFIKFQLISRGKDPSANYRWILFDNGDLYIGHHSEDTSDRKTPFDLPIPKKPRSRLDRKKVQQLTSMLININFLQQEPYQLDKSVEDGGFFIIKAKLNGNEHEVIYDAYYHDFLDTFLNIK